MRVLKMEVLKLKTCPKCKSELETNSNGMQVCNVCEYWTKQGTARLDSITISE
jgi:uncharacterized Zn finger protein (UPF0148 family)